MTVAERLYNRWKQMVAYQSSARSMWQDLGELINPKRSFVTTQRLEGQSQTQYLFDSTAIKSNDDLAAFISGTLTNMSMQWFGLTVDDLDLQDDHETRRWLDDVAKLLNQQFRASNLATELQEAYKDLGAFGIANLLLEEQKDESGKFIGFLFRAEAVGTYAISENDLGFVDTVFRNLKMPGQAAFDRWGHTLPDDTIKKLEKNPDEKVSIIHAVFPRKHMTHGLKKSPLPFASIYFEESMKKKLQEGGYEEMPYFVPRWSKTAGEIYGRGPGHIALPDILSLNKAIELTLAVWGKIADPPYEVVDDAILSPLRSTSGGLTYVRAKESIRQMTPEGRFDVNQQLIADVRASIKEIFFANQFTLPDKTIITATEVERRLELMQQVLGPVVGRLEFELLSPLINRSINILERRGMLPPMPTRLAELAQARGGINLVVRYEGPLARAQRNADIKAANDAVTFVSALQEVHPRGRDNVDWDLMIRDRLIANGLQSKYLIPEHVRNANRKAEDEQAQQAAQAEQNQLRARAAKDVAGTLKTVGETAPEVGDALAESQEAAALAEGSGAGV